MLDINLIIEKTEYVQNALKKKGFDVDFEELKQNYNTRKQLIAKADELKTEKNKLSASVPVVKKQG
ncbi:MAG: serine--tRNA ligase, partial [Clostridia bacterium]|nr:serine--tRNA ligase [Clostridia bacterium]